MQTILLVSAKTFLSVVLLCSVFALDSLIISSNAMAQMSREPFRFRVHGNPTAANMAVIMRQVENGGLSGNSSAATLSSGAASSNPMGAITQYSSTTIGNMNEITTILESGSEGYVSLDTTQDGSQSNQSATSEGTQIFGGNHATGGGDPTVNDNSTTNVDGDQTASNEGSSGDQQ